ncbi:MAG TPA: MBL fold metallo-hydrolase [Rhizomicrobium sp.]|jgi:glyoxylase-like metal-dependent hydrolase (beta-lactamase superfamily II)|nr:MBL fold metallo-hydrolase [Rhizomicrobium sp.]
MEPAIQAFFDEQTFTVSYLVSDPVTKKAVIIDSVLDFDPKAARTATRSADRLLAAMKQQGLTVEWILETHAHADHLSAAVYLKAATGAKIAIGEHIKDVQKVFAPIFNAPDIKGDGAPFDRLLRDGETLAVGGLTIEVMNTPGHTPACVSYRIGDNVFVGDTLFMPDYGTARADFPGGDAHALYRSIKRILSLPPNTRLWMCHDYKPAGRDHFAWQSSVGEERSHNVHVHDGIGEEQFVASRQARDKTLAAPVLILPSIQVNIRAGRMPPQDANGQVYLKLPVDRI